jgi:hypothetical protein
MLNWISAQAPFQGISTGKWLQNHCSHHERCINTIGSSNIKLTKKSYKSKFKGKQWTNYIFKYKKGQICFRFKKKYILLSKSFHESSYIET